MKYEFTVLDLSDARVVIEVAECLAETFVGIRCGGSLVQEPLSFAIQITKEAQFEFNVSYLNSVIEQGYCFIAKDRSTGRVIGALACEIYDPNEEPPVFEGQLEPMNKIIGFLEGLDARFKEAVKQKTGASIAAGQYIRTFMAGVRIEKNRRQVALEMIKMAMEKAGEQGYKGLFGEATSIRSRTLFESLGFYVPKDLENQPLQLMYSSHETFRVISESVATACTLIYKELDPDFDLR